MALRVAVANGNWSNPATWNGGVLPSAGDLVASNNFTVTIDQNINVDSLTNTAQSLVDSVPNMTSPTSPSGIVTASSEQGGNPAWRAFDGSSSLGLSWYSTSSLPQWIAYEFVSPIPIDRYQLILRGDGYDPKDWTFEAWDGSTWIILDTVVNRTSGGTYLSPVLNNTTAYIQYRVNVTNHRGSGYVIILEIDMFPYLGTLPAIAGGGFILNSGVTVTLTNTTAGVFSNSTTACVTYSASSGVSTINGILRGSINSSNGTGVLYSGGADLNVNGDIQCGTSYAAGNNPGLRKSGTGTLTIVGNIYTIVDSNTNPPLVNTGTGTINITGIIYGHQTANGSSPGFQNTGVCTINITGDLIGGRPAGSNNASAALNNTVAATIYVTGNLYARLSQPGINSTGNHYLNVVGTISSNQISPNTINNPALVSTSGSAINLLTGPFICSPYGFFPYQCVRMHLIPSASSYIEFRDETTNGAISPGAIAPATQLISPSTLVSNLAIADVRFGTVYAMGTLTGTLRMPTPNQVTFGVAVDDTFGNSVLTAASVWDYLVSNITVEGSIGMRLKNVATPQTIGEQLEAFLRLD